MNSGDTVSSLNSHVNYKVKEYTNHFVVQAYLHFSLDDQLSNSMNSDL